MKPHQHAELIKAWADGAQIERQNASTDEWFHEEHPEWLALCDYRIKPVVKKPVVRWLWATRGGQVISSLRSDDEMKYIKEVYPVKLEWSRTEFDE